MQLDTQQKKDLFQQHGYNKVATDTGSPESQVALFTTRIAHLTAHLKVNKKDFSTRMGLMKLVGKRRKMLSFLQKTDVARYRSIIAALNIRK